MKHSLITLIVLCVVLCCVGARAQNSNNIVTFQTDQQTFDQLVANSGNALKIIGYQIVGQPSGANVTLCFDMAANTMAWCPQSGAVGAITATLPLKVNGSTTAPNIYLQGITGSQGNG